MAVEDQATTRNRFEFRPGVAGFPGWEGQERDGDPCSIAPNRPRLVINGRYRNKAIESRGGQDKLNLVELSPNNIRSIFDHQEAHPVQIAIVTVGCTGPAGPVGVGGFSVGTYNWDQDPEFQRAFYYSLATDLTLANFDGRVYLSVDEDLKKLTFIDVPYGQENFTISGVNQDVPVHTFANNIKAMESFDGKLFIALGNGATSKVYTYDGLTTRDDTGGNFASEPRAFGLYRDHIVLGYTAAANKISVRARGESGAAVWTDVAGAAEGMYRYALEFSDRLFWIGNGDDVWQYNGTAVSSSLNIVGAVFTDIAVADGFLYACYNQGGAAKIARYSGSAWTNVYKDFTGTLADVNAMYWYKNSIWVQGGTTGAGVETILYSQPGNPAGTYSAVISNIGNVIAVSRFFNIGW
jgi:hypothetical protein